MSALSVSLHGDARTALCAAFDAASQSIDAEFYDVNDAAVVGSLNRAAARGVRVRVVVEGDRHRYGRGHVREPSDAAVRGALDGRIDVIVSRQPHALIHAKAAVVDGALALVATANATETGFGSPGEALVIDRNSADARSVAARIADAASGADRTRTMRPQLDDLFRSPFDLRVASEDLSDPKVVAWLVHRVRNGHHDRVLVGNHQSKSGKEQCNILARNGVDIRVPREGYMHEKYVDAGARLYIGSANLTRNGIDEAREIGIFADAADFDDHALSLRADFDDMWAKKTRAWG